MTATTRMRIPAWFRITLYVVAIGVSGATFVITNVMGARASTVPWYRVLTAAQQFVSSGGLVVALSYVSRFLPVAAAIITGDTTDVSTAITNTPTTTPAVDTAAVQVTSETQVPAVADGAGVTSQQPILDPIGA